MFTNGENIIALDIDGTVCTIETDYSKCVLLPGAIEGIKKMREQGYMVYLYTGRHINNFEVTKKWLNDNEVPHDHLIFGKPVAKYYIDDRGIRFNNWKDLMDNIEL